MTEDNAEEVYSSVEVTELVNVALSDRAALSQSWLETRLYDELYESLSKYLDKTDLLFALSELRGKFLEGFTHTTPQNLHQVCKRCRLCEGVKHPAADPNWNIKDPDLMIVVDNPTVAYQYGEFLTTALKTVGFKGDRCMLTYLTRCPIQSKDIQSAHIANCVPYLHSEMVACNPKLVLILGSQCWGAVTGDVTHKISDLEGDIVWFGTYPLLPGMALAWYSRTAEHSTNRGNGRFVDLLSVAYNFLYASSKATPRPPEEAESSDDEQ